MYKIIAICGKSGVGKDSILKNVLKTDEGQNFCPIVSYTTRPQREKEIPGVDYFFISKEEFFNLLDDDKMLEHTYFNDWYYGTGLDTLSQSKINIGVFNPDGIATLMKDDRVDLKVFWITTSGKTRLLRQLNREENPDVDEIVRRYSADEIQFRIMSNINYETLQNETRNDFQQATECIMSRARAWQAQDKSC